jgi:hypothetical protein
MLAGAGFANTPSFIIRDAPPGSSSSPGWKISFTVPSNSARSAVRMRAVASNDAVCTSWPQACITPGFWER